MDTVYNDERLIDVESIDSHIENEHRFRYKMAAKLVKGKRVLDVACGSGYGSVILAKEAKSVIGVDYSQSIIDYCVDKYQRDNLQYQRMSAEALDFPENSFDVVVSFETVEHLTEDAQKQFLAGIKKVLCDDGLLIISSPNKDTWSKVINKEVNVHHLNELNENEFKDILEKHFKNVDFYYQNYIPTTLVTSDERKSQINVVYSDNFNGYKESVYGIALCSDSAVNEDFSGIYVPQLAQAYNELNLGFAEAYLYQDAGQGFCEADKLHTPVCFGEDDRLCAEFRLTKNASAIRFDLSKQPFCIVRQIEFSDKSLKCVALNGIELEENSFLFYDCAPIMLVSGKECFAKGEIIKAVFGYEKPSISELLERLAEASKQVSEEKQFDIKNPLFELLEKYRVAEKRCSDVECQLGQLSKRYLLLEQKLFVDGREVSKKETYYLNCMRDKDVHIENIERIIKEKDMHIENIEECISSKDIHIKNLETALHDKDVHIVNIEAMVRDKDVHIGNIESDLRDKAVHIGNMEAIVRDKDGYIGNLETVVRDKDVHICNLEKIIADKENDINAIKGSFSWKITAPMRRIRNLFRRRK